MEKHGYSLIQRFFALLLCVAMLVPTALVPVSATEVTEPAETVSTETVQTEATDPEESEPEWILPECDCGSTEAELGKHGETCARKVFLEEFCKETAADIFAKWEKLPEECQKYILEYLSKDEADTEKLAELKGFLDAAQKEPEQTEDTAEETEGSTEETEASTEEEESTEETEGSSEEEESAEETEASIDETEAAEETEASIDETEAAEEDEEATKETEGTTEATEESTEETEEVHSPNFMSSTGSGSIIVIAGSDYQGHEAADNEANTGTARAVVTTKILNELASCGIKPDGVLFCGDYTRYGLSSNTDNNKSDVKRGIDQLKSLTTSVLGVSESDVDWVFTQGNHDRDATTAHGLSKGGANDTEHYGVYVLHNNDYGWTADGNYAGDLNAIKAEAAEMKAYFNEKIKAGYTKPIFIAAHIPLHYSYRTRTYEDAKNARYIFNVINDAGAAGLNIIYLFGHNHSAPSDSYIGGGAAYLGRGDTIFVSKTYDVNAKPSKLTLNFTYMNCGYLSYTSNVNSDGSTPSMAVFEITGDKVEIKRYCHHGLLALKARGKLASFAESSGTVTETYDTYGVTEAEMNAYLNTRYKSTTIEPVSTTNMDEAVEMPQYGTIYYQVDTFKEGQFFAIANYGGGEGQYQVLRVKDESGNIGVRNVTFKKDADGRIYFESFSTDDENKAIQWIWEGYAQSENGTVGSLKNRFVSRYLQMTDDGSGFELVAGVKGLRTTSERQANDTKMYWCFDNKDRTTGAFKGYPAGVFVHSHNELNVVANRYYVLRNGSSNGWSAGGSSSPTGGNGPTYIFKRFTDHITGYSTAVAVGPTEYTLVTGQYESWAELESVIKSDVVVKVDGAATTNFTVSSTADPTTAGEYIAYVNYNGYTIGTIKIHVADPVVKTAVVTPDTGAVYQNKGGDTKTGSVLTVTYDNGAVAEIPVTVGMLRDADGNTVSTEKIGTLKNLTVVYKDAAVSGYTLRVLDKNYPEYPNPGSVRVDKEGEGVDFEKTGAAQVELSATGVPLINGVDIIVMVDTSSSMGPQGTETKEQSRLAQTHKAVNNLIDTLKENVESGILGTTKIAIADFNAYKKANSGSDYANQPWGYYALDGNCWVRDPGSPNNSGLHYNTNTTHTHGARTGVTDPLDLSANAFVDVTTMSSNWASDTTLGIQSGTNYDFAFDAIYQLGHSIQKYNKEQGLEHRELVVIFMSDGCPFQYNYFMSHAENNIWNHWLNGTLNDAGLKALTGGTAENPSMWEHFYNSNQGRHWMAEAIKGNPNQRYKIIRKSDTNLEDVIELNTAAGANQYAGTLPGLGAQMYSIALGIDDGDGKIALNTIQGVLERIASKPGNFYNVPDQSKLHDVFQSIAGTITQAATNSYYLDTMGEAYDLYMSDTIAKSDGTTLEDVTPKVQALVYDLNNGARTGDPTVLETITFGDNYLASEVGTAMTATSSVTGTISFKMGEVLKGEYVWYNTSKTETVAIDPDGDGKTIDLAPETFYYYIGTLGADKEYALNYYVYLEDALDNNDDNVAVDAGDYPTNKSAVLYYKNYLGNNCTKDTVSPELSWSNAKVSYGFYLVDEDGNLITDEATGSTVDNTTTNFRDKKVELLSKTEFATFDLNTTSPEVSSHNLLDMIPEGYDLYVFNEETGEGVTYSVEALSGQGGSWEFTTDATKTTYVTGYNENLPNNASTANPYSNTDKEHYSFTDTTIWFALVAKNTAVPDVVVVDYGLPVEIDVLANDKQVGTDGTLAGIGLTAPETLKPKNGSNQSLQSGFAQTLAMGENGLKYGSAMIENGKVRYSLETMEMPDAEVFYYALNYNGDVGTKGYYYDTVTIIPATTIYYEDSFLTYKVFDFETDTEVTESTDDKYSNNKWTVPGTTTSSQGQDRPGVDVNNALGNLDADNIYGYDGAYTTMAAYSMGTAMKVTVDNDAYATAEFDFWGTGFDIISLTSGETGVIMAKVYDKTAYDAYLENPTGVEKPASLKSLMVDTYYGYTYGDSDNDGDNEWYVDLSATGALYQVPVLKVQLTDADGNPMYGNYTAIITASYSDFLDNRDPGDGTGSYDFYLDAIRIYDPANDGKDNTTIEDAYKADGEGWPEYFELRNLIISRNDFDALNNSTTDEVSGIVFIDGDPEVKNDGASAGDNNADGEVKDDIVAGKDPAISDYTNYGPNNELYLAPGQAIAFKLNVEDATLDRIHLAMKSVGGTAKVTVYNAEDTAKTSVTPTTISTATDLYYDITDLNGKTVVIKNTGNSGDAVLSITNIKVTHTAEHADSLNNEFCTVSVAVAEVALLSLRPVVEEEPTEPEVTEPEVTEPEVTEPEVTEPEVTEPEVTEPEVTEPEVTEPEVTEPEVTEPETTEPEATEPGKPEKFQPRRFEVHLSSVSVKVGSSVVITVTTSRDVESVTVNCQQVTRYTENRWLGTRTWMVQTKMETVGSQEIIVAALNSDGIPSDAVVKTVKVTETYTSIRNWVEDTVLNLISGWLGKRR